MKISCTPISAKKKFASGELDQETYFEFLAENGAEATDLMDPNKYSWFWKEPEKEKREMPQRLKQCGLKVAAYATGTHFAVLDPDEFQKQVTDTVSALHAAAEAGATVLRVFGGYHKDLIPSTNIDYAEGLKLIIKGLESVLPEAQKCGVSLALENHGRLPGLSAELLYVMRHFDVPEIGVCMDIGNFLAYNMNETENPIQAYESLKKYLKHVHFKDWKIAPIGAPRRVVQTVCGQGDGLVPLRQMAYLLEKDRFEGFCALEYDAADLPEIAQSLQYLNSLKKAAALLYPKE